MNSDYLRCVSQHAIQLVKHSALGLVIAAVFTPASMAAVTNGNLTGGSSQANGGVLLIENPAPVLLNENLFDDDNVRAFDEVQSFTLLENLIMDQASTTLSSNVLGPDSLISSHLVIFDPASSNTAEGTVTFSEPVVGIIRSNIRFDDTDDLLGNPNTNYQINDPSLDNDDSVTIAGNSVTFSLQSNSPGDAFRVITSENPQPGINVCADGTETLTGVITGGAALSNGGQFRQICSPIGPVGDDNFDSFDLFAFEEQQAVELAAPLALDSLTNVPAGEFVSSFYVIWDPIPFNRVMATVTFPDTIIGVISDQSELEASEFLGNSSAMYLNPGFLGLENGDTFVINDNELSIDFSAGTPGDSIRVILGSASPSLNFTVCEPAEETLSGEVTGGTALGAGGTFSQLCGSIGAVGNDNFQSNDLFVFEEAQNVVLDAPLELDELPLTTVPAGTEISSYYVAFDPPATRTVVGNIVFPGTILGLATNIDALNDSDFLGNVTADYLNPSLRGLEDEDTVSFTDNVLNVSFGASSPGDYIRVIVETSQPDTDNDGVADNLDNCLLLGNPDQLDTNGDGYGNLCDPDLDNNGFVNFLDVSMFVDAFGTTGVQDADINGDGFVNFIDFAVIPNYFGQPPGPSGLVP